MRIQSLTLRLLVACGFATTFAGLAVAQTQGVTDSEIVLGSHQDLSGPLAAMGGPFRDGLILAAEDINAAGGINGRKIRIIVEDNGYDPKKAVLATQKMLNQDKVFALISTLGSATTSASMPLATDRGVPVLFAGSATESAYLPYSPLKFGLATLNWPQVRASAKYAYEKLGKRRFGILYQDDDTGLGTLRGVEDQLKAHGLSLVERTSYKRGEIDFSAQIARLKAADVDVVMLGTIVRETAAAEIEAKKQNWPVDMIATQSASHVATLKLGGPALEGMYLTTQFLGSAQEITPELKAVMDRYKARFGRDMVDGVNYSYTAMMLFAEGAKNAGRDLTPQTLAQGLEKVKNFKTVFEAPPVSYAPNDHAPPSATIMMQVRGGKFTPVTGPITY